VEATEEKRAVTARAGGEQGREPPTVIVRLRPLPQGMGTALEIIDQGMGMSPAEVEGIWTTGSGRHGSGRGHGLTESKRAFLLAHGNLEVRSQPGVGTVFRIDIPFREIGIPRVPLYRLKPAYVPLAIAAIVLVVALAPRRRLEFQTVRMLNSTTVEAIGSDGNPVWTRDLGEQVLTNDPNGNLAPKGGINSSEALLVTRGGREGGRGVILATQAPDGPGRVWFVGRDASWSHTLGWHTPARHHLGNLICVWEKPVPWKGSGKPVVALGVRDGNYSASSVQFFTTDFDSLGAYYHDGHLSFCAADDFDGDGRTEVLLFGINNPAQDDSSVVPRPQPVYLECLVLLEVPEVSGQGYPWKDWPGMAPAAEEGYLILTPLLDSMRPTIRRIDVGRPRAGNISPIEVWLDDGRNYHLDGRLRPVACTTGDFTQARALAPTKPIAPLVYFSHGKRELIDLVVE